MNDGYFSNDNMTRLINVIRQIVRQEIISVLKSRNLETFVDLRVLKSDNEGGVADLTDLVTGEIFEKVPNQSGAELSENDIVRVYTTNQTQNNQYIGINFGHNNN